MNTHSIQLPFLRTAIILSLLISIPRVPGPPNNFHHPDFYSLFRLQSERAPGRTEMILSINSCDFRKSYTFHMLSQKNMHALRNWGPHGGGDLFGFIEHTGARQRPTQQLAVFFQLQKRRKITPVRMSFF